MNIRFYLHATGEALAFLCIAGFVAVYLRWKVAQEKDLVLAFGLTLTGLFLREYAVWRYEAFSWADDSIPLYITTLSRILLIASAAVYFRGAVKKRKYGEWMAPILLIVAFVFSFIV